METKKGATWPEPGTARSLSKLKVEWPPSPGPSRGTASAGCDFCPLRTILDILDIWLAERATAKLVAICHSSTHIQKRTHAFAVELGLLHGVQGPQGGERGRLLTRGGSLPSNEKVCKGQQPATGWLWIFIFKCVCVYFYLFKCKREREIYPLKIAPCLNQDKAGSQEPRNLTQSPRWVPETQVTEPSPAGSQNVHLTKAGSEGKAGPYPKPTSMDCGRLLLAAQGLSL